MLQKDLNASFPLQERLWYRTQCVLTRVSLYAQEAAVFTAVVTVTFLIFHRYFGSLFDVCRDKMTRPYVDMWFPLKNENNIDKDLHLAFQKLVLVRFICKEITVIDDA